MATRMGLDEFGQYTVAVRSVERVETALPHAGWALIQSHRPACHHRLSVLPRPSKKGLCLSKKWSWRERQASPLYTPEAGRPRNIDVLSARVIERESSAIVHARTPKIAEAVRFVRQHHCRAITAQEVADHVGVSRSTLERGMKEALGRTPLQEILRLRFAAVRELLAETDLPIKVIALRCGFPTGERLSMAFASAMGMTPSQFRSQQRGYAPSEKPGALEPPADPAAEGK
jgi:AraC-like DNA-binding protein